MTVVAVLLEFAKIDPHRLASAVETHQVRKGALPKFNDDDGSLVVAARSDSNVLRKACNKLWWTGMSWTNERLEDDDDEEDPLCKESAHCINVPKGVAASSRKDEEACLLLLEVDSLMTEQTNHKVFWHTSETILTHGMKFVLDWMVLVF